MATTIKVEVSTTSTVASATGQLILDTTDGPLTIEGTDEALEHVAQQFALAGGVA